LLVIKKGLKFPIYGQDYIGLLLLLWG
jgi:hypothetical protein